ncbi:MAG: hypothetical protein ACXWZL_00425 [Mycobacterium sp.]
MSTDHVTFDNPVWGSPEPAPRRWGARETAAAVGIAAVIAGLGGAAIYAATGDSSPDAMGPAAHQAFPPPAGGGPASPGGPMGPFGQPGPGALPLHGQFVVSDGSGGYTTMLTQTGTITAVSSTSVTVRSEDGFSRTYLTSPNQGAPSLALDDAVTVRAVQEGDTARVTEILGPQGR